MWRSSCALPRTRLSVNKSWRKSSQFYFNTNRTVNTGEREVSRRPNEKFGKNATDLATCPSYFADYAKTTIRRHFRRCGNKNSKQITGRVHYNACEILRGSVFPTMQEDKIVTIIRYDELVIIFGKRLCQKYKDPITTTRYASNCANWLDF